MTDLAGYAYRLLAIGNTEEAVRGLIAATENYATDLMISDAVSQAVKRHESKVNELPPRQLSPLNRRPRVGEKLYYMCDDKTEPMLLTVKSIQGDILHFTSEWMDSQIIWNFTPTDWDRHPFNRYLFIEQPPPRKVVKHA